MDDQYLLIWLIRSIGVFSTYPHSRNHVRLAGRCEEVVPSGSVPQDYVRSDSVSFVHIWRPFIWIQWACKDGSEPLVSTSSRSQRQEWQHLLSDPDEECWESVCSRMYRRNNELMDLISTCSIVLYFSQRAMDITNKNNSTDGVLTNELEQSLPFMRIRWPIVRLWIAFVIPDHPAGN